MFVFLEGTKKEPGVGYAPGVNFNMLTTVLVAFMPTYALTLKFYLTNNTTRNYISTLNYKLITPNFYATCASVRSTGTKAADRTLLKLTPYYPRMCYRFSLAKRDDYF